MYFKKTLVFLVVASMMLLGIMGIASAQLDLARTDKLNFNHVMDISGISTTPDYLTPGKPGTLQLTLRNTGGEMLKDVIFRVNFPDKIAPSKGIDYWKTQIMSSGEANTITLSLIVQPDAGEGVYKIPFSVDYLNSIGDERTENGTLSVSVGGRPNMFVELKSADIYQGHPSGTVTVRTVNNNLANVKFLTVQLGTSSQYTLLSYPREYVGDLKSDDTQETDFKILVLTNDPKGTLPSSISLPVQLVYKDFFNRDFADNVTLVLPIRTAAEMGIQPSYAVYYVLGVVVIILLYMIYREYKKRKKKQALYK